MRDDNNGREVSLVQRARRAIQSTARPNLLRDAAVSPLQIDGYDLIREIGRGGQGIVYQALQQSTGRFVAVKILRHGLLASAAEQARLDREVRILAKLNHPGIITIHDSGRCGNLSYVVMDYIEGVPLDVYIASSRPSLRERISLLVLVAEAVHAAHVRGIIHRDLKPANIRVDADGRPHVHDFGVAKLLDAESPLSPLTVTGQFVGSLQWAAPEQARGDQSAVDTRTDVYALGVVFWHALTGAFPYPVNGDMSRLLNNIMTTGPTQSTRRDQRLPIDIETVLRKCLAKEPERRYQNAGDLAADLRNYLDGRPISARRDSQLYVLRKTIGRYRLVFGLAAAIFLLAVGAAIGLGILFVQSEKNAATATQRAVELRDALYFNSINLAEKAYETGNPIEMNAALEQCTPGLRGWEYWHLKRLTDESALTWQACEGEGNSAEFSPDGRYLLTCGLDSKRFPPVNRTTKLWDASTGQLVREVDTSHSLWGRASLSPDGKRIAVGGKTFRLRVFDTESGQVLYEIDRGERAPELESQLVAFTGDSSKIVLAEGYNHGVRLFDAASGEFLRELKGQPAPASMAAAPDGKLIAIGGIDANARLWSVDSGELLATMTGHQGQVRGVAFSPDGTQLVTAAWDGRLRGWDLPGGALRFTSEALPADVAWRQHVAYSPDGRYLASSASLWVELWDARLARRLCRLLGHTAKTVGLSFSPDSRRVACIAQDGMVRIWDLRGGRAVREVPGAASTAVAWSPDGRWIATNGDGRLVLIDAATDKIVWAQKVAVAREWAVDVAFSPEGRLLASSGATGDIEFRDVATGDLVRAFAAHVGRAGRLAWSRDGRRLASLGTDQFLRVWESTEGKLLREILVGTSEAMMGTDFAVAFSPDGQRVAASARDNVVRVWDVATGDVSLSLAGHENSVGGLCFTSDGRRIITSSLDATIRVWDARSGACERTLRGPLGGVRQLALMPDDRHLFCAGPDIRLWDIETGRRILTLRSSASRRIALSPDARRLAAIVDGGALTIWDGSPLE